MTVRKKQEIDHEKNDLIVNSDQETTEVFQDEDDPEIQTDINDISFDDRLREWIDQESISENTVKLYLYKFDSPTGQDKSLIFQYSDDIPDLHTIGMTHGSGRYLMIATSPIKNAQGKKPVRSFRFKIHAHYDELRRNMAPSPLSMPMLYGARMAGGNQAGGNPTEVMQAGLSMVSEVVKLLAPLLVAGRSNNTPDMSEIMMRQYGVMSEVMKNSLLETNKIYSEIAAKNRELVDNEEDEGEEKNMLEKLIPLFSEFIPLLTGKGIKSNMAVQAVKSLPDFAKVITDKKEIGKIISYLDNKEGKEKTDIVLKRLGISRG